MIYKVLFSDGGFIVLPAPCVTSAAIIAVAERIIHRRETLIISITAAGMEKLSHVSYLALRPMPLPKRIRLIDWGIRISFWVAVALIIIYVFEQANSSR